MHIPEYFCTRIVRAFGEEGAKWIAHLPQIIDLCIGQWQLTECVIAGELSINFICFARSARYGEVVLKIGSPHPEVFTEMTALALYEGRNACKCYEMMQDLRAMLLERITPGPNLTAVPSICEQLAIAVELIAKLPIPATPDHGFPTYAQWLDRAFTRARKETRVGARMLYHADTAERLYRELEEGNRPRVLLHGDLHHWNILQDHHGQWKAIDPQGVIGVPCMEAARFMNNHIGMVEDGKKAEILDEMVTVFGDAFNEPKRIIAICLYVLLVLSICWTYEEADPNQTDLAKTIYDCELVLDYLTGLDR